MARCHAIMLACVVGTLSACSSERLAFRLDCLDAKARAVSGDCGPPVPPVTRTTVRISPPGAQQDEQGAISVLVDHVVRQGSDCRPRELAATVGYLALRVRSADRMAGGQPKLEIAAAPSIAPTRLSVVHAWNRFLVSPEPSAVALRRCLTDDAAATVRSYLATYWPAEAWSAFAAGNGFDPTEGRRAFVLRPGMKVCAREMKSEAASNCAHVVNSPRGGMMFDPGVGRIPGVFDPPPDGPPRQNKVEQVRSWAEIPFDDRGSQNFIVVIPRSMVRTGEEEPGFRDAGTRFTIFAFDSRSKLLPRIVLSCSRAEVRSVNALCGSKQSFRTCAKKDALNDPAVGDETLARVPNMPFDCYQFGIRTTVQVLATISVNGRPVEMPVGTTLGDLLDRFAPTAHAFDLVRDSRTDVQVRAEILRRVRITRRLGSSAFPVDTSSVGPAAAQIPLQHGDSVVW